MTQLDKATAYRAAQWWYNQGINTIPVEPNDKKPAEDVIDPKTHRWKHLQQRRVTPQELDHWWNNGFNRVFNIGLVHGEVSNNFASIDIDHDQGIFEAIKAIHPQLTGGMIEQSGSQEGYHIPLFLNRLPDFGHDDTKSQPKGNQTWKTRLGNVNIRARFCQTVAPPSIHPSGNPYTFLQRGKITRIDNLDDLIGWLDQLAPERTTIASRQRSQNTARGTKNGKETLLSSVLAFWGSLSVFQHLGVASQANLKQDKGEELRVLGNGGLLINLEKDSWYCFEDEEGGGPIEAWAYCRFGRVVAKKLYFRQILLEMAIEAGIDIAQFYRTGDEKLVPQITTAKFHWEEAYGDYWQ
jgi:hypothetical protein